MDIHLARDGSALGIFSEQEVRSGLATGRFRLDDLGWREGMPAWIPLSTWSEFAGIASPPAISSPTPTGPSELPWEVAAGFRSLLRSAWWALSRPAAFARARLEIGSAFAAAYLAMGLLAVPMLLLAPLNLAADRTRTTLLAEALAESEYPKLAEAGRAMLVDVQGRAEPGLLAMACGTTCFSAMYPLVMAVAGMLLWLALRAQGLKPEFARTVAAGILISGLLLLGFYPASATVSLLGAVAPLASLLPGLALGVAAFALGCRATGAALGFSGWRICLAWLMLGTVGCAACCCCCGALGLLAGASA